MDAAGSEHCRFSETDKALYAYDASGDSRTPPDLVIRAVDTAQISRVLACCSKLGVPVTPRGAATGLSGGCLPVRGGVVLDMAGMNRILDLHAADMVAVVQPGVVNRALQNAAAAHGLFFPPDPASLDSSTLGGNLAENAGGPKAVKYGVTRDYVLGLTAVLADGRVFRTGGRTIKNVAGYDLTSLLVGSEGTLAVIVEAVLRLAPLPESQAALNAFFPSTYTAAKAVQKVLHSGVRPVALEFLDTATLAAIAEHSGLHIPQNAKAMVLVAVDGSPESTVRHTALLETLLREAEAVDISRADSPAACEQAWKVRRAVGPSVRKLAPACIAEDIVVPLGSIADMVEKIQHLAKGSGFPICCYGHAGDGNLHVNLMYDNTKPEDCKAAWSTAEQVFAAALQMNGSISGEHGIGSVKLPYLAMQVDPVTLELMQKIRQTLDPAGILNPSKGIPAANAAEQSA